MVHRVVRTSHWKVRLVSAAILAPLAVGLAYGGTWYFGVLVAAVACLALYEWLSMVRAGHSTLIPLMGLIVVSLITIISGSVLVSILLLLMISFLFLVLSPTVNTKYAWIALGIIYIGMPCIALVWLRTNDQYGLESVLMIFGIVWATDAGAFVVGSIVGGPRLAPRVSPLKTWSGAFGGIICGVSIGVCIGLLLGLPPIRAAFLAILGVCVLLSIFGQLGDLFESILKRRFNVKNSGVVIPGHGGVLDRIDSLLFVAPSAACIAVIRGDGGALWR